MVPNRHWIVTPAGERQEIAPGEESSHPWTTLIVAPDKRKRSRCGNCGSDQTYHET